MTADIESLLIGLFLLFCRIGGCILVAPGFSSPRVPVGVRLFLALAVTAALSPLMFPTILQGISGTGKDRQVFLIVSEAGYGLLIGLMARCFFLSLQFAATAISNFIGLSGIPGIPLEENDTGSPLATLASTAAVTAVFVMGLHVELLKALMESYSALPLGRPLEAEVFATNLLQTLGETWLLALRLCAPFLLYGVIVNLALGLANRFAQQISIYHATTGAVMLGGFLVLYLVWSDLALAFIDAYRSWLLEGGY